MRSVGHHKDSNDIHIDFKNLLSRAGKHTGFFDHQNLSYYEIVGHNNLGFILF